MTPFSSVSVVDFEQVNASWVCQFVTFWQFVSKILVRKVLKWLLWSAFTLYWLYYLPADIHLLKPIPTISKQKSSGLSSDVTKIIWRIEVLINIEAFWLWCFAIFGEIPRFIFPGSCWSIINVGWHEICTIGYWYCYFAMFL